MAYVYGQAGATETTAEAEEVEDEDFESYTNVPKKGNLRLTGSLAFTKVFISNKDQNQIGWRGVFDYHVFDMLSISGISHLPLASVDGFRNDYFGLGGNVHPYNLGDLGFHFGATAGFVIVQAPRLATKAVTGIEFNAGLGWYGSFFHLMGEVSFRFSEYYSRGVHLDMNELIYSGGIGFKL